MSDPVLVDRPSFGAPYELWLAREHSVTNLSTHRNHYDIVSQELARSFQISGFWRKVLAQLPNTDARYLIDHKYPLVATFTPEILIKPWASFLEKSYRINIARNPNFPSPPADGWCLPPSWHTRIHDIVRTTIVVRYLDGVPLVLDQLRDMAASEALVSAGELEARVDGYYGGHFNCHKPCEISALDWSKITDTFQLEIQVTTSIKDVIKTLLHRYYEATRLERGITDIRDISWKYDSEEFIAAYLGHILHYVEGMIIEVRDRKRGSDA
jgi:hypothetical protein